MTTPDTPTPPATRLPNARVALVPGLVAGLIGAALSGIVNYRFVGMPDSEAQNLLIQGVSGLVTGMLGGVIGLRLYLRRSSSAPGGPADLR